MENKCKMITWTNKGKEYWESYGYYKGKSISIRAYVNGRYMILKNEQIALSGKADNREKAIEALESYLYLALTTIEDKESLEEEEVTEQDTPQEEVIQTTIEEEPKKDTSCKVSYTIMESPTEKNSVLISFEPKEGSTIKYTTNGKKVIPTSRIYKGEFIVDKGTPINYTVYDADKNIIEENYFIGE